MRRIDVLFLAAILALALALAVSLSGCKGGDSRDPHAAGVLRYFDNDNGVVCYRVLYLDGISCVQVRPPAPAQGGLQP